MTAATYTFTLSAAQSTATSMVVAMRAKPGSSIPGNASRWQGGVMPQATLNWAAGAMTATATVNTAPNSAVDGNAEYEWYKVSSTPSDLTLTTTSLPTVTITDDDSAPPSNGVLYNQTSTDSGYWDIGANGGTIELLLNDNPVGQRITFISDTDGEPRAYLTTPNNGTFNGYVYPVGGPEALIDGNWNNQNGGGAYNNTPAKLVLTATTLQIFIGDMTTPKKTENFLQYIRDRAGSTFNNVRVQTGGAPVPIKITKA